MSKKVKVIDVNIDMDVEERLKQKMEEIKLDVTLGPGDFLVKIKPKVAAKTKLIDKMTLLAIKELIRAYKDAKTADEKWVSSTKLLMASTIDDTKPTLSNLVCKIRRRLDKAETKWLLNKKTKFSSRYYCLERCD